jgi:hypothetical protein
MQKEKKKTKHSKSKSDLHSSTFIAKHVRALWSYFQQIFKPQKFGKCKYDA